MYFLVVDTKSVSILGLESCENLKLIKCICSIESKENSFPSEFSDCFREIGTLNKTNHIKIKEDFNPVVTPMNSSCPKTKVEKELKRVVDLDIIEPVDELTDWVNGLFIVEKANRKLQICLDLDHLIKQLNESISTSLPRKNSFPKCQERSTFQN